MYYLLENNRIINSNNFKELVVDFENNEIKKAIKKQKNVKKDCYCIYTSKIKKQSENVYDLIDWEKDLIGVDIFDEFLIYNCKTRREYSVGNYILSWIKAIYKPNSNGDYIKVWEKKDGSI